MRTLNAGASFEREGNAIGEKLGKSLTIINKSVARANNYITIDKGKIDGIKKGMGVVSNNGVIGIVKETSKHFSSANVIAEPLVKGE
ncbi:rod shape-determining protein MreC [bacterium]|nr:rod shape-determining protein MreC [bacterium]